MKRYLVFYGDNYYPSGGMSDLLGSFDTLTEGVIALENKNDKEWNGEWDYSWGHISDGVRIVWDTSNI